MRLRTAKPSPEERCSQSFSSASPDGVDIDDGRLHPRDGIGHLVPVPDNGRANGTAVGTSAAPPGCASIVPWARRQPVHDDRAGRKAQAEDQRIGEQGEVFTMTPADRARPHVYL